MCEFNDENVYSIPSLISITVSSFGTSKISTRNQKTLFVHSAQIVSLPELLPAVIESLTWTLFSTHNWETRERKSVPEFRLWMTLLPTCSDEGDGSREFL